MHLGSKAAETRTSIIILSLSAELADFPVCRKQNTLNALYKTCIKATAIKGIFIKLMKSWYKHKQNFKVQNNIVKYRPSCNTAFELKCANINP